MRALVTIASVFVGGIISWLVASANAKRTADRADRLDWEKQRREVLLARLQMQRAAYEEFLSLFAKHQAPTDEPGGIVASLQRKKSDAATAHTDAVTLYGKLALAFGSTDFAGQVSQLIEMASAARGNAILESTVATLLGPKALERMREAIVATETQLEVPPAGRVPEPLVPAAEYNEMLKDLHLKDVVARHGLDPARLEAILKEAKSSKPPKS